MGVSFLILPYGFWELNLVHQCWPQVSIITKPYKPPPIPFLICTFKVGNKLRKVKIPQITKQPWLNVDRVLWIQWERAQRVLTVCQGLVPERPSILQLEI